MEVIEGLNNIIGDIMSFGCRWPDIVTLCVVAKKSRDNVRLVSTRVVLSERLKGIHGHRYRGDLCGRVCSHTTSHR